MKQLIIISLFCCWFYETTAQVKLPRLVRDSMILQRDAKIKLWGWAGPAEKIKVHFRGANFQTTAGADGRWAVYLPPTKAGGPYNLTIAASNKIVLHDILFGDVWLCSGQSNMFHQLNVHDVTYRADILAANDPDIRQFAVPMRYDLTGPQADLPDGYWAPAVGEQVRPFSAVAYFFAKKIHDTYHIPVGIINASVGGTPIEAWISEDGLKEFPEPTALLQQNKDTAAFRRMHTPVAITLPPDAGLVQSPRWYDTAYIPKGWRTINIPGYWEDQGAKDLNGVVWYRNDITLPASMKGKAASVFLGRIVDADELYINGVLVGRTAYQYPQRRYQVPAGVLKTGRNLFVVRVTNTGGKGGFVPDKPYCIFSQTDTIDLKGYWQYKVGAVYAPVNSSNPAPPQYQPAALYNAMVAPFTGYAIKGICWYQGEANTDRADQYKQLLPALIHDWRHQWLQDSLPFLYVQLPGFMDYNYLPTESNWARLREAQLQSLSVPRTAMAVAIDLGEWNDIHPDNKKSVGERLALAARGVAYAAPITYSGPLFHAATITGNKIEVSFTHTGSGLTTIDGDPLSAFEIAGADKKFVWAQASINGNQVTVWSDAVSTPLYVRYAWSDNPLQPNLCNREGLPASPFRTDR
ncbi:sialate O-acetylesterase [Chitinophaga sp. Ak27]|uniref:sialate O-acetylesterase n=1 Tax=Chitinophaga sp. Ak27 TaxID=2726116 RepID=UPI00293BAA46|nr:sialate O-acetylesterase [Chitinophaga sp. Ak27]